MAGCWMNTGEGGLSPWHLEGGADIVFQIGTAKYGVRDDGRRLGRGQAAGHRRPSTGADVRDQAEPGRQAGQGRHPAGRQGHGGNRHHPRHPGGPGFHQPQPPSGHRQRRRPAGFRSITSRHHRQTHRLQTGDRRPRLARRPVPGDQAPRLEPARPTSSPSTAPTAAPARRR